MRGLFLRSLPPEARRHWIAARKERLLALRALVDAWLERLEGGGRKAGEGVAEAAPPPRRRGGGRRPRAAAQ